MRLFSIMLLCCVFAELLCSTSGVIYGMSKWPMSCTEDCVPKAVSDTRWSPVSIKHNNTARKLSCFPRDLSSDMSSPSAAQLGTATGSSSGLMLSSRRMNSSSALFCKDYCETQQRNSGLASTSIICVRHSYAKVVFLGCFSVTGSNVSSPLHDVSVLPAGAPREPSELLQWNSLNSGQHYGSRICQQRCAYYYGAASSINVFGLQEQGQRCGCAEVQDLRLPVKGAVADTGAVLRFSTESCGPVCANETDLPVPVRYCGSSSTTAVYASGTAEANSFATLQRYPGYVGPIDITGDVTITDGAVLSKGSFYTPPYLTVSFSLIGLEPHRIGALRLHRGTSCFEPQNAWYRSASQNPWELSLATKLRVVNSAPVWVADDRGVDVAAFRIQCGISAFEVKGHAVVVYDSADVRVACGVLGPNVKAVLSSTSDVPGTATAAKATESGTGDDTDTSASASSWIVHDHSSGADTDEGAYATDDDHWGKRRGAKGFVVFCIVATFSGLAFTFAFVYRQWAEGRRNEEQAKAAMGSTAEDADAGVCNDGVGTEPAVDNLDTYTTHEGGFVSRGQSSSIGRMVRSEASTLLQPGKCPDVGADSLYSNYGRYMSTDSGASDGGTSVHYNSTTSFF